MPVCPAGTTKIDAMRASDGEKLCRFFMGSDEWELYLRGEHPAFDWPKGLIKAGDFFTDETVELWGMGHDTVIYLERKPSR